MQLGRLNARAAVVVAVGSLALLISACGSAPGPAPSATPAKPTSTTRAPSTSTTVESTSAAVLQAYRSSWSAFEHALADANPSDPDLAAPGTTPVLFVHGINSGPWAWTRGDVDGMGEPPLQYVQKSLGNGKVTGYTFDWSKYAGGQGNPVLWVTSPLPTSLGAALSQAIACVARNSGHQVIIIAHSMGGLITQDASSLVRADIASVFTLGTPYQGSWAASAAGGQRLLGGLDLVAQVIRAACGFQASDLLCIYAAEQHDPGVEAMRLDPPGGWKARPAWPARASGVLAGRQRYRDMAAGLAAQHPGASYRRRGRRRGHQLATGLLAWNDPVLSGTARTGQPRGHASRAVRSRRAGHQPVLPLE